MRRSGGSSSQAVEKYGHSIAAAPNDQQHLLYSNRSAALGEHASALSDGEASGSSGLVQGLFPQGQGVVRVGELRIAGRRVLLGLRRTRASRLS